MTDSSANARVEGGAASRGFFGWRGWEILLGKTPAFERRTAKPYRTTDDEVAAVLKGVNEG